MSRAVEVGTGGTTPTARQDGPKVRPKRGERAGLVLLVLAGLTAIGPAMSDMYLAAFPDMSDDFQVGASQLQLTLTASMIGAGLGQLLVGPLSDRFGRRRPLIIGMTFFTAASLLCALAPTYEWFIAGRVLQGLTGATGVVISRAIVRDLYSGDDFVRFFAKLMLIFGLAPVLAPMVGTGLLNLGNWQYIFYALAGMAAILLVGATTVLGETHPPERRSSGGVVGALKLMRVAVRDRRFVLLAVGNGFASATMFVYIGSFSFIVQNVFDKSSVVFGLLFGLNACGFVAAGQLTSRLVGRYSPRRLLMSGTTLQVCTTSFLALFVLVTHDDAGTAGLIVVEICCFLLMCSHGTMMPNSAALALENQAAAAGTAVALMGCTQQVTAAIIAPIGGIGGDSTAVPLGCATAVCALIAFTMYTRATRVRSVPV